MWFREQFFGFIEHPIPKRLPKIFGAWSGLRLKL
jgi:hypothetical protein